MLFFIKSLHHNLYSKLTQFSSMLFMNDAIMDVVEISCNVRLQNFWELVGIAFDDLTN